MKMETELQSIRAARKHWENLSPHIKERASAQHLLKVILVAEALARTVTGLSPWVPPTDDLFRDDV